MKLTIRTALLSAAILAAAVSHAFAIQLWICPNSTTQVSGSVNADYSSTHLFVDEINGDSVPIYIYFDPQDTSGRTIDEADIFTNLNNRDRANLDANGDGIPDGILPPDGNYIVSSSTTPNYFQAYAMNGSGPFSLVLHANKTGAYRLTARYHYQGDGPNTFQWYDSFQDGGKTPGGISTYYRDAAIVVSPAKARQMSMYEVNPLYIDAEEPQNDTDSTTRSTFDYFDNGPNAPQNQTPPVTPRPFNLNYVKSLGVNWLWLQPIHPIGIQGRQTDPNEGNAPFSVGSPYSVMNFFQVNPLLSKTYVPGTTSIATGRANAMIEFQNFVKAADAAGVNVMLDVPFNHTSFDCELDGTGVALFGSAGMSGTSQMQNVEARIYARWNGGSADQTNSANFGNFAYGCRANNAQEIALAADRFDFGKFVDVHEVYFGNFASRVCHNDSNGSSDSGDYNYSVTDYEKYLDQGDWFDTSIGPDNVSVDNVDAQSNSNSGHFDSITQNVWKYFAWYIPYWLQQTGHTDSNGNLVGNSTLSDSVARRAADDLGLDGIRADFAQGLPPQLWEYIMNYARSYKWDFVFMAESLDGGNVTYRSNRHFDVVNENVLFDLYNAQQTQSFRNIYDGRRNSYGQSLVLWDTESHDEAGYTDPYQALIRYAVNSTIDGVPDIFYGQEIGISGAVNPFDLTDQYGNSIYSTPYGFTVATSATAGYQVNFGKPIPNFMIYNSIVNAWNALGPDANGQAQLYPVYSAIANARLSSPALQSSNRYYLNDMSGNEPSYLFGVAKYANTNAHPNLSDVVFAFVNLSESSSESDVFNVNITQNGSNLFGIDPARTYNIKNISADTEYNSNRASVWIWSSPGITGSNILNNGIYVGLNAVPSNVSVWGTAPYEAQYLKLYDVTPPPAPAAPTTPNAYSIGGTTTFTWSPGNDPEGGVNGYSVIVSTAPNGGGTVVFSGTTATNSITVTGSIGQTLYATVTQINGAGIAGSASSTSAAGTLVLDPNGDQNGCGLTNAQQAAAGFSPLDNVHWFHITSVSPVSGGTQITWQSIPGRSYLVQYSTSPTSGYAVLSGTITASGATTNYTDTTGAGAKRFYEVTTPYQ